MRSWRNWQTRTVQVRVGDHGGSNPFDRTKTRQASDGRLFCFVHINEGIRTRKGTAVKKFVKNQKQHLQKYRKNSRISRSRKFDMRSWRNWQTRKTKDLVSPRHAGAIPVDRTKKTALASAVFSFANSAGDADYEAIL